MESFAKDFFRTLGVTPDQNMVVSPLSVRLAMLLTAYFAHGNTREEILEALGYIPKNLSQYDLSTGILWLGTKLMGSGFLKIANTVFVQGSTLQLMPVNKNISPEIASLQTQDFENQPEAARIDINHWIFENTGKMIPDLLPKGSIDSRTIAVIANALYYNAPWLYMFNEKSTMHNVDWDGPGGGFISLMNQSGDFLAAKGDTYRVIFLPASHENLGTLFFDPKEENTLPEVLEEIGTDPTGVLAQMQTQSDITIALPRHNMASGTLDIKPLLRSLGITTMFTNEADFSGISPEMFISDVFHGACIKVNEQGTVGGAATAGVGRKGGFGKWDFYLTKPFLFAVIEMATEQTIFFGQHARSTSKTGPATRRISRNA